MQSEYWQRQKTLLTEREVSFMKGLFRIVDMKRWYLCPQVRVADIVGGTAEFGKNRTLS